MTETGDTRHDGVSVGKSVFPDADPLPTVVIDITNERAERVVVRLADDPPVDVPPDDVGFGPNELDRWRVDDDGAVRYRRAVPAGRTVVTTYYLRTDAVAPEAPAPPELLSVEPVEPTGDRSGRDAAASGVGPERTDRAGPSRGDNGGSATLGATEEGDGSSAGAGGDPDGEVGDDAGWSDGRGRTPPRERLLPDGGRVDGAPGEDRHGEPDDPDDPQGDQEAASPWGPRGGDGDGRPRPAFDSAFDEDDAPGEEFLSELAAAQPISWGEVAHTLAEELRHGTVDDAVAAELRAALLPEDASAPTGHDYRRAPGAGTGDSGPAAPEAGHADAAGPGGTDGAAPAGEELPTSVAVRLDRLDAKTERLAAYTDALEEFLTEEGTGRQALASLDERVAALEDARAARAERVSELEAALADLSADVDALTELPADVADLDARLESADDTIARLRERLEAVEQSSPDGDEFAASEDLAALSADVESLADSVEELQAVRDRVSALEELDERVATLSDAVADLGDLEETVADNEAALADVRESVDRVTGLLDALSEATRDDPGA